MIGKHFHGVKLELAQHTRSQREARRAWTVKQRLAMNEMTTYRWSFFQDVMAYRAAGLSAIGVWRPKIVDFGEERAADLLGESGLAVASLSWAGGFTGSDGNTFQEALDDARDAVRLAGQIRSACLVVVSGARGGHTHNHARRLVVDALRHLGDLAGEVDLQIALQPVHPQFAKSSSLVTSVDKMLDILASCQHPQVGMALDVYQLRDVPGLVERIPEILPWVKTVQLSDGREPGRSEFDRCPLGEGTIPLAEIVVSLEQAGYRGFYDVQILSEEAWNSNYRELLERCQTEFHVLCSS